MVMNLEDFKKIDELLDQRAYLIAIIDGVDPTAFRCVSLKISDRIWCKKKIIKRGIELQYDMACMVYNTLIEELTQVHNKLRANGIEVEEREYIQVDKQVFSKGLTDEIPDNNIEDLNIGHIMPRGDNFVFDMSKFKYSE